MRKLWFAQGPFRKRPFFGKTRDPLRNLQKWGFRLLIGDTPHKQTKPDEALDVEIATD